MALTDPWTASVGGLFLMQNDRRDVCFWHLADIPFALPNVRFRG
jgi:hypothetical protein